MKSPLVKILILFLLFHLQATSSLPLHAQETKESKPPLPDVLDYDRRKATDQRLELSIYGGDMLADQLNHSFIVGGDLQFNITHNLAIAGDFGWSIGQADKGTPFGDSITNDNLYFIDGAFVSSLPGALGTKSSAIEVDFFTSVGAGVLISNNNSHLSGFVGGGMKIRPNIRWLAFRADVRNYFTSVDNPAGSDFEYSIQLRLGPTFLLPPEL